jgi:SAM-dependent methyltransferase
LALAKQALFGKVVATDISADMLEVAKRRAAAANVTNIEFKTMDLENIDYLDGRFDAVTSRFGVMFCPDPARAIAEIQRVLKRGCRFAIAVWDEPSKSPAFSLMTRALAEIAPPAAPPDPKAPGMFRLAPPGELDGMVKAAGFSSYSLENVPITFDYESVDQFWQISTELAAPLKAAVDSLSAADQERLRTTVNEALQPHIQDGRVRLTATPLCASGVK